MGAGRAVDATSTALSSPLLEEANVSEAKGILVNVTAADLTIGEYQEIGNMIEEMAAENANIVIGTTVDDTIGDELRVTMVATGIEKAQAEEKPVSEVVRPIGKAVGGYDEIEEDEDLLFDPRSALNRDLPPSDDVESRYDIPTILREQHD